jgi:tetratricopeptide (TPR) repeat protein
MIGRACVCLLVIGTACHSAPPTPPAPALLEVTLPDLSRADASVQQQVRDRFVTMQQTIARQGATDAERGQAYGDMGKILQAGEYFDAAEPAYVNAQRLMPREPRWPYFLAHLHRSKGDITASITAFRRVLEIVPDDVPTLIWLGRMYLDQGQPDQAEPLFARARALAPHEPAVLAGLGQSALARRDYGGAVSALEEALSIDGSLASIHSPLAMAYRGLGDTTKAEAHLKQWRNTDILVPDPFRQELDLALESGLSFELRGVRALEQRDFKAAAEFFKRGIDITPGNTTLGRSLRHKMGTALYLNGDSPGAVKWFEETIRLAPENGFDQPTGKAHYSLGVLMASNGRSADAITHLAAAVRFSPNYVEAHIALGDALRRAGRVEASMEPYREALRVSPKAAEARFGYGMALVRLGRYGEARDWFADAANRYPDRLDFQHALARLLAAAPDDRVRDGRRAQTIVEGLIPNLKTLDLGETLAMALAEQGQFADAVAIQRGVIDAARQAGFPAEATRMVANLQRYERRQPCREPWSKDDVVNSPGPPVDPTIPVTGGSRVQQR